MSPVTVAVQVCGLRPSTAVQEYLDVEIVVSPVTHADVNPVTVAPPSSMGQE